jgi:carboxyl-terminal processing protease
MRQISLFLLFAPLGLLGQTNAKTCEILAKIDNLIEQEHFKPKPIDDSLSVFVFDSFVDGLDEDHNLFTKAEYETLKKHRLTLDDDILNGDCSFMNDFTDLYRNALLRKKTVLEKISGEALDFSGKDSIRFSRISFPFDLTESDFERVWRKRVRFEILEDISKISNNLDSLKQNFSALEKAAADKIFQSNLCKVTNILDNKTGIEQVLQNDFLNYFCTYFDPHTNYFFLDAKTSFMSALSTNNLSLGLGMGLNEKEEIVVEEIIPGGPAAQSQQFERDDVIVKVANKQGNEFLVSCTSLDAIGELIFSDANKELVLTVRKKNGSLVDVSLQKQVMKASENSVYSFIAESKGTRVGYIKIPNFYSDFEGHSIQGCATDVANEIGKLQRDKIEGLVIDLQDNGGGSMEEAMKLAGMFVDNGPVSISVNRNRRTNILKDSSRGVVYNGPMVLLINGSSASASEFFSGAMQDYNRALVVGAPSLGKASIQTILPLDHNEQEFVKLTIQKFYRITGESSQIKGIVPDIMMPVIYDSIMPREKSYKTALEYDFITTKARFTRYETDFSKVIQQSRDRIKADRRFVMYEALNKRINSIYTHPKPYMRLMLDDVFPEIHSIDELWKKIKNSSELPAECVISNTEAEIEKITPDPLLREINEFKIKDVRNNPYLAEAVLMIRDFNSLRE